MRSGWVIPTVGGVGAVREMVEVSNVLVRRGHEVIIFHPDGTPCMWLPCLAKTATLQMLKGAPLDVLIGIIDWQPELYAALVESRAKVKAVCLMGFTPSDEMAAALRGEAPATDRAWGMMRDAIAADMLMLADSSWQVRWLQEVVGVEAGPAFGGINTRMFYPPSSRPVRNVRRVLASGDPRARKGSKTVQAAIATLQSESDQIEADSYWGRRFSQKKLVEFLQGGTLFLDAHYRAGWCNPVAEAMACGTAVVCTDIGAVSDFAIHEETALLVPIDDDVAMAQAAKRLLGDEEMRQRLIANGLECIRRFDYEIVAPRLEQVLEGRLNG